MVPVGGVRSPFTIARYSLCTRRFLVISAMMLALTRCLEITVSPVFYYKNMFTAVKTRVITDSV